LYNTSVAIADAEITHVMCKILT